MLRLVRGHWRRCELPPSDQVAAFSSAVHTDPFSSLASSNKPRPEQKQKPGSKSAALDNLGTSTSWRLQARYKTGVKKRICRYGEKTQRRGGVEQSQNNISWEMEQTPMQPAAVRTISSSTASTLKRNRPETNKSTRETRAISLQRYDKCWQHAETNARLVTPGNTNFPSAKRK